MSTIKQGKSSRGSRNYFKIRLSTWHKISHSLYDYSEENSIKTHLEYELPVNTMKNIFILRNDKANSTILEIRNDKVQKYLGKPQNYYIIAKIIIQPNLTSKKLELSFEKGTFEFGQSHHQISGELPSLVVAKEMDSKLNPKGCVLKTGNIIYFGRIKYLVREIKMNNQIQKFEEEGSQKKEIEQQSQQQKVENRDSVKLENTDDNDEENKVKQEQQRVQKDEKKQCRICFEVESETNPLVSVCKCTGSCKYTHFKCLKYWVDMRAVINNRDYCMSVQKVDCEVCKSEIPMTVNLGGKSREELVLFARPRDCDYLILEKLEAVEKNILIIKNPPYQGVSVGRDASSYIRINDISVSRVHAFIKYNRGEFCIYDNKSKFGTLVRQQATRLEIGRLERAIQIGRTLLEVVVKEKNRILQGI